ncbi:MAG: four helix bundle protein [Phycisphaerales bacterium]|nr:four helix bundle protein [Phycisphaerales bacterium]MCB9841328.1 four helix bundle protein [Phycisphaeraceae bacterium]
MATIKTFRDLIAWQRGMDLAVCVYKETAALPSEEKFGLTAQMRRAAVSIPSNIAEGHARQSRPDFLRFLRTARGSLGELSTQTDLCRRLEFFADTPRLTELLAEEDRILQALIRSLERKATE